MTAKTAEPAALRQLLYVSIAEVATTLALETAMADILRVSQRRNAADDITGMLICDGYAFAQVLEGEARAVEACFERIRRDRRHHEVTLRMVRPTARRNFPNWSMCGLTLSPLDDALLTPTDLDFSFWSAAPEAVMQVLASLAERHAAELNAQHAALIAEAGFDQAGGLAK